jgi:hypothetical protein
MNTSTLTMAPIGRLFSRGFPRQPVGLAVPTRRERGFLAIRRTNDEHDAHGT